MAGLARPSHDVLTPRRRRAAFYSRFRPSGAPSQHVIRRGGRNLASRLFRRPAQRPRCPLISWRRAENSGLVPQRRGRRTRERRPIAPHRIQDPTEPAGQRDHRNPFPRRAASASAQVRSASCARCGCATCPRRLNQHAAGLTRPDFRNVAALSALARAVFARHQPEHTTDVPGRRKARPRIERRAIRQRRRWAHARHTLQARTTIGSASASAVRARVVRGDQPATARRSASRTG